MLNCASVDDEPGKVKIIASISKWTQTHLECKKSVEEECGTDPQIHLEFVYYVIEHPEKQYTIKIHDKNSNRKIHTVQDKNHFILHKITNKEINKREQLSIRQHSLCG